LTQEVFGTAATTQNKEHIFNNGSAQDAVCAQCAMCSGMLSGLALLLLLLPAGRGWVPLSLNLGVPLFCPTLCQQVCNNMSTAQCLTSSGRSAWRASQLQLQQQLWQLVGQFGTGSSSNVGGSNQQEHVAALSGTAGGVGQVEVQPAWQTAAGAGASVELPSCGLLFDGRTLLAVDVGECLQGVRAW
jgi:hypothetical protein